MLEAAHVETTTTRYGYGLWMCSSIHSTQYTLTSHRKIVQLRRRSAHKQPVTTHGIQAEKELHNTWVISGCVRRKENTWKQRCAWFCSLQIKRKN